MSVLSEPLFNNAERYQPYPVKYRGIFNLYEELVAMHWNRHAILADDLQKDGEHIRQVPPEVRQYVEMILAFFAEVDGVVADNIVRQFLVQERIPEVCAYHAAQMAQEVVHALVYNDLLDAMVPDPMRRSELRDAARNVASIKRKEEWAIQYMDPSKSYAQALIGFCLVEGLHFASSFAGIYWLRERYPGMFPGLVQANAWIARDETHHCDAAIEIYRSILVARCENIEQMVREAVDLEVEFAREGLPVRLIGLNADLMEQYIKFVADGILNKLGMASIYGATNPFPFMAKLTAQAKGNFFETQVTEYQDNAAATAWAPLPEYSYNPNESQP